jgi:hypothetical protein
MKPTHLVHAFAALLSCGITLADCHAQNGLYVVTGGNVGVKTSSPTKTLDVNGDTIIRGVATAYSSSTLYSEHSSNELAFFRAGSSFVTQKGGGDMVFYAGAGAGYGVRMTVRANSTAKGIVVSGNLLTDTLSYTSDEKIKENITPIGNALDRVSKLNGYKYSLKADPAHRERIGLTAQNVEAAFPEAVSFDEASGLKTVEYANLIAPLIEAVKEQQKLIEAQEERNRNLQDRLAALENGTVACGGILDTPARVAAVER